MKIQKQIMERKPNLLTDINDIKALHSHLEKTTEEIVANKSYEPWDNHSYVTVRDVVVTWFTLTNGGRGGKNLHVMFKIYSTSGSMLWLLTGSRQVTMGARICETRLFP